MKKVWPHLKNKYIITSVAFVIWMLFFDRNDLISQFSYRKQLNKLITDKEYYMKEIAGNKQDMNELMSDREHLEKFARERYLMKKDNEDIFLILPEKKEESTAYAE
jgi:cell division protein FtsB